ncbi:hypothetical protein AB0T83_15300 [Fluviibacterium sp. DFM31]|uniref:Uncharacterized protein n=1 Tax=Meridianimarinicoccus marinus TaxID=3231483 RepID=A0ABV3L982_9RHOB
MSDSKERERASIGAPWMGMATLNPMHALGEPIQGDEGWQGWVFAIDADTGAWAWRAKIRYPEACDMTPTDGGFT